jgi:hypothetical protein
LGGSGGLYAYLQSQSVLFLVEATHRLVDRVFIPRQLQRRAALERRLGLLQVDVEQPQLAGDEVRVRRVPAPGRHVDDVEASDDALARRNNLCQYDGRRLATDTRAVGGGRQGRGDGDGEVRRSTRRVVGGERGHAQPQLALAQARARARHEALEALGAVRRERKRRARWLRRGGARIGRGGRGCGGRRSQQGGDLIEARLEGLQRRAQRREEPG